MGVERRCANRMKPGLIGTENVTKECITLRDQLHQNMKQVAESLGMKEQLNATTSNKFSVFSPDVQPAVQPSLDTIDSRREGDTVRL